jgi:hypothetical protein
MNSTSDLGEPDASSDVQRMKPYSMRRRRSNRYKERTGRRIGKALEKRTSESTDTRAGQDIERERL